MKIIYKKTKTILEKIDDAIKQADWDDKDIDKVIVSKDEFDQLVKYQQEHRFKLGFIKGTINEKVVALYYDGVRILPEEKETHQEGISAVTNIFLKWMKELEAFAVRTGIIEKSYKSPLFEKEPDPSYKLVRTRPNIWVCDTENCLFFNEVLGDYSHCDKSNKRLELVRNIISHDSFCYKATCATDDQKGKI